MAEMHSQARASSPFELVANIKGITVFKFFIWGSISSDIRSEFCFTANIRRYTSPNENFEYGYPHSNVLF